MMKTLCQRRFAEYASYVVADSEPYGDIKAIGFQQPLYHSRLKVIR